MSLLRHRVKTLYRNFLHYGKDWPGAGGQQEFRRRVKAAFIKNKDVTSTEEIEKLIARGEYVLKEIDALYRLKKYRHLKRNYYQDQWDYGSCFHVW